MKAIFVAAVVLLALEVHAKFTVAVIDTGMDRRVVDLHSEPNDSWYEKGLCKYGHKDFTGSDLYDRHGHGTNISGLIHKYAKGEDYCQVVIKYYDPSVGEADNMRAIIQALEHAVALDVDMINISGGGTDPSGLEQVIIRKALDKGIIIVAAAGNERSNIDKHGYYPASYFPEIIVVGSTDSKGDRLPSSNYGMTVDFMEIGKDQQGEYGPGMTGTSQATAIVSGKEVGRILKRRSRIILEILLSGRGLG